MLAPGMTVGGYRVERILGRGGMAEVYEATQLCLDRPVALKVLAPEVRADAELRERFRREGRAQAALEHPSVVPIYEAGEWDGTPFIAMRLVRGPTLKALVGTLDPPRALRLLGQVAAALDEAHGQGLVHRDIKPQNVLVAPPDRALLADFGLTRADRSGDPRLTRTGQLMGSIDYMPPEQAQGEGTGPAGDRYAFACVAFECLTGRLPYVRPVPAAVLFAHLTEPPPRPSEAGLPAALDDVFARGLAKDPAQRPATARELITHVAAALRVGAPA